MKKGEVYGEFNNNGRLYRIYVVKRVSEASNTVLVYLADTKTQTNWGISSCEDYISRGVDRLLIPTFVGWKDPCGV